MRSVLEDVRGCVRTLRKQPMFVAVVVLSLGLSIALNTSMYGMLDALMHPRTDIREPRRLYWLRYFGDTRFATNAQRDAALRSGVTTFEASAYISPFFRAGLIEHEATVIEHYAAGVGLDFFSLLDGKFVTGRAFLPSDQSASVAPVIINERLASRLLPGQRQLLGERIRLGDSTFAIIGVLSKSTQIPDFESDIFILAPPPVRGLYARLVRIRHGATIEKTNTQLDFVSAQLAHAAGKTPLDGGFRIQPAYDPQYHYQGFHVALILAVSAVLLIACANVANMQLARGISRRRELALRAALGASRRLIIRQLLVESVLLCSSGLCLGLLLTAWATAGLHAIIPPSVGKLIVEPQWSWRVLVSSIVATVVCIVVAGLAPSISVSHVDPNELLKSGAGTGATRRQRREYGHLVAAEIALALFLLSGAAALVRAGSRSFNLVNGYDITPLATADLGTKIEPGTRRARSALLNEVAARARALSGAAEATALATQQTVGDSITIADPASALRAIPAPLSFAQIVTPSYLRTLGLPLLRGRDFIEGERDAQVAIIDDFTAMSLWPNGNPIGALIKMGAPGSNVPYVRVVGVFGYRGPEMQRRYEIAELNGMRIGRVVMLANPADSIAGPSNRLTTNVIVRSASGEATKLAVALRRAGFTNAYTLDEMHGVSRARQSLAFIQGLFVVFALFGLVLAAFGVYGIVAHSVAQRRRELGVRIALGATPANILHAVLRETVVIGLAGVAVGLIATKYGVQMLATFALDEIYNAPLFASAAALLLLVAGATAFVPALRATRVDPTESLRSE